MLVLHTRSSQIKEFLNPRENMPRPETAFLRRQRSPRSGPTRLQKKARAKLPLNSMHKTTCFHPFAPRALTILSFCIADTACSFSFRTTPAHMFTLSVYAARMICFPATNRGQSRVATDEALLFNGDFGPTANVPGVLPPRKLPSRFAAHPFSFEPTTVTPPPPRSCACRGPRKGQYSVVCPCRERNSGSDFSRVNSDRFG